MATILSNTDTNVSVYEVSHAEFLDAMRTIPGINWPDLGEGEGDQVHFKIQNGLGAYVELDQSVGGPHILTFRDVEPGGAPEGGV